MTSWDTISFSDSASPSLEKMVVFHDHVLMILTLVTIFLGYSIWLAVWGPCLVQDLPQYHELEVAWTCIPGILLLFVVFPSLHILYTLEEAPCPSFNFNVSGAQWFWSYEYNDFISNSYLAEKSTFRLLDVSDHPLVPEEVWTALIISSVDVIHAWALPSLGVKVDAIPGRLNIISLFPLYSGIFYGQCSEICGRLHSFMPISVEIVPIRHFLKWLYSSKNTYVMETLSFLCHVWFINFLCFVY